MMRCSSWNKSVAIFESDQIHSQWHQAWAAKEEAIRTCLVRSCEQLEMGSRELPSLREGDHVFIQNQDKSNGRPTKWDRQGTVVASKDNDQYLVKVHGSGRITLRNRRFLRKFQMRNQFMEDCAPWQENARAVPQGNNVPARDLDEGDNKRGGQPHCAPIAPASVQLPPATLQGPEVIDQAYEHGTAEDDSGHVPSSVPEQPVQAHATMGRGRGRPPKRTQFNFMPRLHERGAGSHGSEHAQSVPSAVQEQAVRPLHATAGRGARSPQAPPSLAQQQPVDTGAHFQDGIGRATCRRSTREGVQRRIYDASTGQYINPCG